MIQDNLHQVEENIRKACERAGRASKEVTLICVSKTKPMEMIQEAYGYGKRAFGENKAQEMRDKHDALPQDIEWHFIGHLQTNKVKYVVGRATLIHSVDSIRLAEAIETESDKKNFIKLFGEYLRVENILQNFDEFTSLKAMQEIDISNEEALNEFKLKYYLDDAQIEAMKQIKPLSDRIIQDYKSTYNDICEWRRQQRNNEDAESDINWNDVVFEIDLLKSQEINLDYILELIFEANKTKKDKQSLVEDVRRLILNVCF